MLKIRLKKIMNVMFIVLVLEVLGCGKTYSMEKNPTENEINTNGNQYQETYGAGFLLGGYDLNDSYSSSVSNENKVVESGKYRVELEPIKPIKCVEKNSQNVMGSKNNKNNNNSMKENEDVIFTSSKHKEVDKGDKDNFDVLKINEEKKKLNGTHGDRDDKIYNFGGVLLTKEDLEYNKSFFSQNKNKLKGNEKKVEEKNKKTKEDGEEDILDRIKNIYFYDDFNGSEGKRATNAGDYVLGYKNILSIRMPELIKKARGNYIRYLNGYLGLLQSKSILKLPLEDGDALYPTEKVLSKDYMYALLKAFRYIGQGEIRNICAKKNLTLAEYFNKTYEKLFSKYKGRIYNNAESLGFTLKEAITNFLLESQCKIYYDMLNDEDLFYYKQTVKEKEVEGYKLIDIFSKMQNIYSFYKEPRTGINLVVFKGTTDSDLIIYIKNPNRYVLNLAENLSKDFEDVVLKKSDLGLQIILKRIDNRGIGRKDGDYRIFERLIPIIKNVYCSSKERDILFILLNSYAVENFMNDFIEGKSSFMGEDPVFFRNVLHSIRDKLLSEINDDKVVHEYELAKEFEDSVKEVKEEAEVIGEDFFKCSKGTTKYVVDVRCDFPKDFFAKDKDIFNFYGEFLTDIVPAIQVPGDLDFQKIRDFEVVSRNMEDYFQFKVYTDYEDVIKNIKSYCLVFLQKIAAFLESNAYSTPKALYNVNQTLMQHSEYLNGERSLRSFFEEHPLEKAIKSNFIKDYKTFYEDESDKEFFKKASAVAFVDWSKLYRGRIPIVDLVIKSFEKESYPFSNYYFDIVDRTYIEDYILRICENIKEGVVKFRQFVSLFEYDKNLFKIKIYKRNK